jgi:hypothetical protein
MAKMELILLDEDLDYGHGLREFLRERHADGAAMKQYTRPEAALEAARAAGGAAVLLVGERYWPFPERENLPAVLLLESLTDTGRLPASMPFAFKYAPLEHLLNAAEKALKDVSACNPPRTAQASGSSVVSLFSAAGGSGKSTAAYNLAVQLARRGEEVCFVSLECLPSGLWPQPEAGYGMAEWLYYARTKPHVAAERVSEVLQASDERRLQLLAPFASPADAADMNESDAELLLGSLVRLQAFRWIVVDLEAGWCPRNIGALKVSDTIFWVVTDDSACLSKTEALLRHWTKDGLAATLRPRIRFTAGKYVGLTPTGYDRIGIEPAVTLPYVPQWKTVKRPDELLKAAFYSQTLWDGFQSAVQRGRGERSE